MSVQHGYGASTTAQQDITISSVDTDKALTLESCSAAVSGYSREAFQYCHLSSATNLQLYRNGSASVNCLSGWQVVEFPTGTIQRGTTSLTSANLTADETLTAVSDVSDCFIVNSFLVGENNNALEVNPKLELTSTTNLRLTRPGDDLLRPSASAWQVAEIPGMTVQAVYLLYVRG